MRVAFDANQWLANAGHVDQLFFWVLFHKSFHVSENESFSRGYYKNISLIAQWLAATCLYRGENQARNWSELRLPPPDLLHKSAATAYCPVNRFLKLMRRILREPNLLRDHVHCRNGENQSTLCKAYFRNGIFQFSQSTALARMVRSIIWTVRLNQSKNGQILSYSFIHSSKSRLRLQTRYTYDQELFVHKLYVYEL